MVRGRRRRFKRALAHAFSEVLPLKEEPSVLTESTEKCSSWFEETYTSFLTAAESLLKWLYIGIEWPRDINQGIGTLRTVTRFDQHPVNDVSEGVCVK